VTGQYNARWQSFTSRVFLPSGEEETVEFTQELGIRTSHEADGTCRLEVSLAPLHMSRAERVHGGLLFTLLDTAMGRSVLSALPAGRGCATVECKINYFRPVQRGTLVATAELKNLSRNTAYSEGSITDEDGQLVARASGTFFLTDTLAQTERERV
jgi:acyl-CoA thioesterase